ncbi:UDP-N-acetylglucosamine pyrophosphorylase [Clostridium gasigenes]|uniref:UDP-N-acetylglucosamine pyrophosphorylase n=1 Tax=Clostridium gasigenes TaxID=94869 RepID=UPI001C0ADC3B|nr:UDP-N-acetylglucosamine pyrophosphorylase [Clostridium gasigenes]MBU3104181.1 UDP-N-acetylglucosamine pyrophosphorylase [Clostridium gasigenes]MBU3107316.1 UDP-N-acetylglucosamine pyrophosphorylase [Clostridium gasigenes]
MKYELTLYELGKLLKNIREEYKVNLLSKITLSGGWMTITGSVDIEEIPKTEIISKGNNIISIKVKTNEEEGSILKITGAKDKKFNIDIAQAKFKVISATGININRIQTNNEECKLRIDEDMIFTINTNEDNILKFLQY